MQLKSLLALVASFVCLCASAQEKSPVKFGKINAEDFKAQAPAYDSGAAAMIISDVGSTDFVGNKTGGFDIQFKRSTRIRIFAGTASDYGNIVIPIHKWSDGEDQLKDVRASSYNLENGSVKESKLDAKSIMSDSYNKSFILKKFAIPNVKEGSIIEYEYTVVSRTTRILHGWEFQREIPILWSQYSVAIPKMYDYAVYSLGVKENAQHTTKEGHRMYTIRDAQEDVDQRSANLAGNADQVYTVNADVSEHTWLIKDVHPLKPEPFTSTIDNYTIQISFQLSKVYYPDQPVRNVMSSWKGLRQELMSLDHYGEYFAEPLTTPVEWLESDMKSIYSASDPNVVKARKIYNYVHTNFTCTNDEGIFMDGSLRSIWKSKKGNVAEINQMLVAMLRYAHIDAYPVLVSTRDHGFSMESYPLLNQFNYLVVRAEIDGQNVNMDASDPWVGYGHLPIKCYNGHARQINENVDAVYLNADDLRETSTTVALVKFDANQIPQASINASPGAQESMDIRRDIKKNGRETFFKEMMASSGSDVSLTKSRVDSLDNLEVPVVLEYSYSLPAVSGDRLYINPMLSAAHQQNYFKAVDRSYPVEMPYTQAENYFFSMVLPEGYAIEEMPKSERIVLNGDAASFEYIVGVTNDLIQLKSVLKFNKATYKAEEYKDLRNFYAQVLRKHAEQIVLKKKK